MPRRMTFFDSEIAERILAEVARGRSLTEVCSDPGMPARRTVRCWIDMNRNGFAVRFGRAREAGHGRPTWHWYNRDLADRILQQIAAGRSVAATCRDVGLPSRLIVCAWVASDHDGFAERYRRARETGHGKPGKVTYSAEVADRLLAMLMQGELLTDICQEPDMPAANTVHNWVSEDRDGFARRYQDAREAGFHCIAERLMVVADDHSRDWIAHRKDDGTTEMILDPDRMQRARLRFSSQRWTLTKVLPNHYGNRPGVDAQSEFDRQVADLYNLIVSRSSKMPGAPDEDEPPEEKS
jgi:hypothetical protein